jgi:predicted unusual protein kinase regulating ubiquinone biosynthesis (AarF/ABC1/UbiB family)
VLRAVFKSDSDVNGLVDEWGRAFVNELDYRSEARNAEDFMASIVGTPLEKRVFAPQVVRVTERVLVTEWVDGVKLDTSTASDVSELCSLAMNTYLTMMLSSGNLHADPHPGNLLRTPDGRLCILDWGLVTQVEPRLRTKLVEHVAHLVAGDYEAIPQDLVDLSFVPSGAEKEVNEAGVVDLLTDVYSTWAGGGGAKAVSVNEVFGRLQDLQAELGSGLFVIPPYFAYIAKCFSVLEGIGLSADPNYSILRDCLPYISQRLITDPSPENASALATFVYTCSFRHGGGMAECDSYCSK